MSTIPVTVAHGGKKYNIDVDLTSNGETFKFQVYSVSGVEPERQKIIVKGGQLKDDADMSKLGLKANQKLMLIGTPSGAAIEKPKEQIKFLEDMTAAEAAQSEGATPAGLQNLGNTCYMNATLQTLRAIPELQTELLAYKASPSTGGGAGSLGDLSQFGLGGLGASGDLTASLRDLYKQMGETQEGFPPLMFLNAFRTAYPQFAERARDGHGYAQQDAEEAWSQIITQLRQKLKAAAKPTDGANGSSTDAAAAAQAETDNLSFVDRYMGGRFTRTEECLDPEALSAGEEKSRTLPDEPFQKLSCHVSSREIMHLSDGVVAALSDTYTKTSPTLGREAEYVAKKKIARLPKYLPVHFVRFFWKRDINKKAKILRKVTFPHELDVCDFCTPELREMLIPVRDKIRDLRKDELDAERARKRQKKMDKDAEAADRLLKGKGPATEKELAADKANAEAKAKTTTKSSAGASGSADTEMKDATSDITYKTDAQIEAERAASLLAAKKAVLSAVSPTLLADSSANHTGLYELRGVVTHQGASADSGHYTAYVKQDKRAAKQGQNGNGKMALKEDEDGGPEKWWWFNDDRVSEVDAEKIDLLAGGGESHSALILLYRAVELPVLTEEEEKAE